MNLEKVIKVTQSQYDILASGGRVGDYVGLQDDYIYMIEDENEYLPTTGGTITGDLTVNGDVSINNGDFNFNNDQYLSGSFNVFSDNFRIQGSAGGISFSDALYIFGSLGLEVNTPTIFNNEVDISNMGSTPLEITYSYQEGDFLRVHEADNDYYAGFGGVETFSENHHYTLPDASGTLALTSDIPSVSLDTTLDSESITVGSDTLSVMTRDTEQHINSEKVFVDDDSTQKLSVSYLGTNSTYSNTGSTMTETNRTSVVTSSQLQNPEDSEAYIPAFAVMSATKNITLNKWTTNRTYYTTNAIYKTRSFGTGDPTVYTVLLPTKSGMLAVDSDLPQVKRYI